MPINRKKASNYLKQQDFQSLFIEELGWDNASSQEVLLTIDGQDFPLEQISQKRGMVVYGCKSIPNYATRSKIDKEALKYSREHFIVYYDRNQQIWQWVKREQGKPIARREQKVYPNQSGEALLQKLDAIAFSFEEEEKATLVDVTSRTSKVFDVDKVTKKFYERFKKVHEDFLKRIAGIESKFDQEWYASLMLNRLMFIYFMQKKHFLNGNINYLQDRLALCQREYGSDQFYSFYRYFLLRLFHDGLGKQARTPELDKLLGKIPYLNGGLFEEHPLEQANPDIQIRDEAFTAIFNFFDQYDWHLDDRPLRSDKEINPDVLGYIFEKYINQKQMGAYYTKEDITEYISKNCIIPYLFDATQKESDGSLWRLLRDSPDLYIYEAVRKGVDIALPNDIAAGISDVSKRTNWNKAASSEFALPTETWREHVARRTRCLDLREKLRKGEVANINDLITYNLDIRQFVQEAIANCEGADFLLAFYRAIEKISILDPTCGSGAFLFAALNILEPIYDACFDRMQGFVDDCDRSDDPKAAQRHQEFREILKNVGNHNNRRYFILKSIMINNLYGVDIMEEATEICKLRLFLKLVSQVEADAKKPNYGIEPLPDIDFNIRAGNTLVGFATHGEVEKAVKGTQQTKLDLFNDMDRIDDKAKAVDVFFQKFKSLQSQDIVDGKELATKKLELRSSLNELKAELDRYLADEYEGGLSKKSEAFQKWKDSHQPFHWFVEFYGIVKEGGFDVIIGNPPYAEIPKSLNHRFLKKIFSTALEKWSRDEDLYTFVLERSLALLNGKSKLGMILPLSIGFSTKQPFQLLREMIVRTKGQWWWSHFDRIPSALFGNEVRTRCTISLFSLDKCQEVLAQSTTSLLRWTKDDRNHLFSLINYSLINGINISRSIPKVSSQIQADVLSQLLRLGTTLSHDLSNSISYNVLADSAPYFPSNSVYIGGTAYNWFPAWRDIPETFDVDGRASLPARTIGFRFENSDRANVVFAILCSSLGYWWWAVSSDGFNLKKWLVESMPFSFSILQESTYKQLAILGDKLHTKLAENYVYKDNKGRIGNFFLPACKSEIEEIDSLLANNVHLFSREFFEDIQFFNETFSRVSISSDNNED
jgi:hypothetical protein